MSSALCASLDTGSVDRMYYEGTEEFYFIANRRERRQLVHTRVEGLRKVSLALKVPNLRRSGMCCESEV